MSEMIEDQLPRLYDSVKGGSEVPWEVFRRLQFLARVLRGAPAGVAGEAFLLWLEPGGGVVACAVAQSEVVIGREEGCDVEFSSRRVSRRHCVVSWTAGDVRELEVTDLGSSNGTWVNGGQLPGQGKRTLRDGDVIELGGMAVAVAIAGGR